MIGHAVLYNDLLEADWDLEDNDAHETDDSIVGTSFLVKRLQDVAGDPVQLVMEISWYLPVASWKDFARSVEYLGTYKAVLFVSIC
jgi:hypothetical protein